MLEADGGALAVHVWGKKVTKVGRDSDVEVTVQEGEKPCREGEG